jgi:hypothetical protein
MLPFALELTGLPALLVFLILLYVFIYMPLKIIVKIFAHAKVKTDRLQKLNSNVVVAEYDPPEGLTPAELGFLFDNKLGIGEVYATILTLEAQGLVTLVEEGGKLNIQQVQPASKDLRDFDKAVLNILANKDNSISVGALTIEGAPELLRSNNKVKAINKKLLKNITRSAELALRKELQTQGYLKSTKDQINSLLRRLVPLMMALIFLTVYTSHPKSINAAAEITILLLIVFSPAYFLVAVFLLSAFQKVAGDPWSGTQKLKQVWPEIEGYREYIKVVEAGELQFESENAKQVIKNKNLPYAIALGFNTGWLEKVEN